MKKSNGKDSEFYELSRKAMEESYQANLDTLRELIEIEFDYVNLWQEYLNAQVERLSNVNDVSDVVAVEAGLATEYTNKFSETSRHLYETISKSMERQVECFPLPADIENLIPNLQQYKDMLNNNTKKANPGRKTRA